MTAQNHLDPHSRVSTAIVHVRWLACDAVTPPGLEVLSNLLDEGERARAARFHFERDRCAYIAAHALTRVMLSAQVPRPAADWRFSVNAYGRPEVVCGDGVPRLRLNLSHTRGMVAVALTLEHDVGIDVEAIEPARMGLQFAERIFTPGEYALLRATEQARLPETLFALWTCKEACVKALGQGLSVPLDAFDITLDPLSVKFSRLPGQNSDQWLLRLFAPTPAHVLALALRHPDRGSVTISAAGIAVSELLLLAGQYGPGANALR